MHSNPVTKHTLAASECKKTDILSPKRAEFTSDASPRGSQPSFAYTERELAHGLEKKLKLHP